MKVLVVAGSSGGHIFPALAFLDSLKERDKTIQSILILPKKCKKGSIEISGYNVKYISIVPFKLGSNLDNLFSLFKFFKGMWESLYILRGFQPDIVVGFGGIISLPLVLFAYLFRLKTLIHEQNVIPGQANRFLAKFTDKFAVSFEDTKRYLKVGEDKIVFSGNPLRSSLRLIDKSEALGFFGLRNGKFTILVMGGSQACHKINIVFLKALSEVFERSQLQVIHLCGNRDFDLLNSGYKDLGIDFKLLPFLKEMQYAYSASDMVLSRAGAGTISELIFFKIPAIIVPYPHAGGHQTANARVLEDKGCAIIIEDNKFNPQNLLRILRWFIDNSQDLKTTSSGYDSFNFRNANGVLVETVIKNRDTDYF